MELLALLKYVGLLNGIAQTVGSNADLATKIKDIAGPLVPALEELAGKFFPGISDDRRVAAGATIFDRATVKKIQAALNTKIGAGLEVDGYYGDLTKEAVRKYQQQSGLEVDGWAGKDTQTKLFS